MRSIYAFKGNIYRDYIKRKRSHDRIASATAALTLHDYYNGGPALTAEIFFSYWAKLEMKQKGLKVRDIDIITALENAKAGLKNRHHYIHHNNTKNSYPFDNAGLDFRLYRPDKEEWCSYDMTTWKAIVDRRLTKKEQKELEDKLWIKFHDPYCDGRDCTGAPFTSWIRFFTCDDRTIILHRIDYDV